MKCPRCGTVYQTTNMSCSLCRRPYDAPAGWEIPEHDQRTVFARDMNGKTGLPHPWFVKEPRTDHTGKTPRTQ